MEIIIDNGNVEVMMAENNRESQCYDEGYQAYHRGVSVEQNPYPEDSVEAEWWCVGWWNADEESNINNGGKRE